MIDKQGECIKREHASSQKSICGENETKTIFDGRKQFISYIQRRSQ